MSQNLSEKDDVHVIADEMIILHSGRANVEDITSITPIHMCYRANFILLASEVYDLSSEPPYVYVFAKNRVGFNSSHMYLGAKRYMSLFTLLSAIPGSFFSEYTTGPRTSLYGHASFVVPDRIGLRLLRSMRTKADELGLRRLAVPNI
jgi:hypothetical protein